MNWANVVSKNIPKETAPPVSAASQPTKNVQKTSSSSSNTAAASSGIKTYDSDFPEFNNTSGPKPTTQQKVEAAATATVEPVVAVAAATAALTINDDTEGFQATNKPKRRSNEGENQQQRENKPFNRERRNNNDNNRRSHDNNRERKQSGSDRQHDNHRDNRKSEGGSSGYRDRRPPRHQNADADNQGADARPKFDFKARKLEEEQQLKERFKDSKANLGFTEATGDLFSVDDNISLAHCVSADLEMGKGIAVEFKKRFGRVDELLSHYPRPGKCSFLNDKQRYVFYLVTKKVYSHKPTYKALEDSLKSMRVLCDKFKVTDIAMPRIGCGLDQLDWNLVSRIIDDVFTGSNIKITIYSLSDSNN